MIDKDIIYYLSKSLHSDGILDIRGFGKILSFRRGDVIKIFRIRTKKRLGSTLLDGDLGFFLRRSIQDIHSAGKVDKPESLTACPIMNFPDLVRESTVRDGRVSDKFIDKATTLLERIPAFSIDINTNLGDNFFSKDILERIPILADHLRR